MHEYVCWCMTLDCMKSLQATETGSSVNTGSAPCMLPLRVIVCCALFGSMSNDIGPLSLADGCVAMDDSVALKHCLFR